MSEASIWGDYHFERTVWADIQLAKLCPGKDLKKMDQLLSSDDSEKMFNSMMDVIEIMNKAFIRKAKRIEPEIEYKAITREELLDLDEQILSKLCLLALGQFEEDGEVSIVTEPKKGKAKEKKSSSTNPG